MWHICLTRWKILWQPDDFWRCDQCLLLHELEGELPACTASSSLRRVREICHCALRVWASSYNIMIQHTITYHAVPYHNIPYHCLLAYTVFSPIHILQAPWSSDSHLFKLCLIPLAKNQCDICILNSHRIFVFLSVFALRAVFISGHARQIVAGCSAGAI